MSENTTTAPSLSPPEATSSGLTTKVLGTTGFGVAVLAYARMLRRSKPFKAPRAHVINALVWSGIGYAWYYGELRQEQLLYKIDAAKIGRRDAPRTEAAGTPMGQALPS